MDDLLALHIFARTAELHSFSRAAASLGVKTSTVSRQIRQLEASLGIALFNRSTRALALTEGGHTLWRQLAPALQAIDQACRDTAALNRQPQGLLRLTAPHDYARCRLMPLLPDFLKHYPQIRIEARVEDAILPMIDQEIDLAIRLDAPADSSLQGRRIAPLNHVLVASPDYLLHNGTPTRPEQLPAHQCLLQSPGPCAQWHVRTGAADSTAFSPLALQGRFRSNAAGPLQQMALAGQGLALLPDWQVEDDCRAGRLQRVMATCGFRPRREPSWVWALYPPKTTVSSKVRAFIDFCVEHLAPPPLRTPEEN